MKAEISVIIPAYNAEKTIEQCLNSIRNQTYSNLEIIVVNDGSTDNTQNILSVIANKDKRVKVIDINNSGVSHARNTGIDNASGDYITFVDSDDTIEPNMYEYLMGLIEKYNVKIAHCSYQNIYEDGKINPVGNTGKEIIQSHDEAIECLIRGKLFIGGLCNKIYDAELFENVRLMENIKFNEDVLMNVELFDKIQYSVYYDKALYNYMDNSASATHTADAVRAGEDYLNVAKEILKISVGKSYEISAKQRLARFYLGLYRAYLFSSDNNLKIKKQDNKNKIIECYKNGLYPNKKEKITVWMYRFIPHLYKLLYWAYDKVRVKKLDPEQ